MMVYKCTGRKKDHVNHSTRHPVPTLAKIVIDFIFIPKFTRPEDHTGKITYISIKNVYEVQ